MPTIPALSAYTDGNVLPASYLTTDLGNLRTAMNNNVLQTDLAPAVFTANYTFTPASGVGITISTGGFVVSAGGVTVTGNSTITGTLGGLTGLTVASGGITVTAGNLTMSGGQAIAKRVDDGDSSTADTIDWSTGNCHRSKLTGNCTYTFSNPATGATYFLEVLQDATGSRLVTWPGTVKWSGGTAPTLTTTINRKDCFGFFYNGAVYLAFVVDTNYVDTT